jgi:hypothetical protein
VASSALHEVLVALALDPRDPAQRLDHAVSRIPSRAAGSHG